MTDLRRKLLAALLTGALALTATACGGGAEEDAEDAQEEAEDDRRPPVGRAGATSADQGDRVALPHHPGHDHVGVDPGAQVPNAQRARRSPAWGPARAGPR